MDLDSRRKGSRSSLKSLDPWKGGAVSLLCVAMSPSHVLSQVQCVTATEEAIDLAESCMASPELSAAKAAQAAILRRSALVYEDKSCTSEKHWHQRTIALLAREAATEVLKAAEADLNALLAESSTFLSIGFFRKPSESEGRMVGQPKAATGVYTIGRQNRWLSSWASW